MIHSPTPPRAGRRLVAAVGALSLASASVLLAGAAPAMAAGAICGTFERAAVSGDSYVVQNNAWGDTPGQCVTPRDGGFTITKAEGDLEFGGAPKSYPSIFAGEHYGEGSNTASLPVKVTEIGSARTSARITEADGAYNAAWDIWANSSPDSPDENDDTEIMVWADTKGGPTPIGTKVDTITVEGRSYDVWQGKGPGGTDVVSYVDQKKTTTPDIPLAPFVKDSISRGATSPNSFITSVQFGFEPWKGGAGLAVDDFTYSPTAERPVTTTPAAPADQEQPPAKDADDDSDDQGDDDGAGSGQDQDEQPVAATTGGRALVGAGSERCVDVAGRSTAKAAPVQLWTCQGDPAQQWSRGEDQSVVNAGSGLCLDVARAATDNGARVQQWTCLPDAPGQQWEPGKGDTLVNPASGRCLDATDEGTANGTRLILWDCDASADNQAWTLR